MTESPGPLSPASVRQALVILSALFARLTEAGYLAGNPLALARRRRAQTKARIPRYLSHVLWDVVKETIEAPPTPPPSASACMQRAAAGC